MADIKTDYRLRENDGADGVAPVFLNERNVYTNSGVAAPFPVSLAQTTEFGEGVVAEFTPLFELDSSNGLSTVYRDTLIQTNGATVTAVDGEHRLRTGASASALAGLRTKERGRYQPGIIGLPGVAFRRPTAPTGEQEWYAGYFDSVDGVLFGEDATGVYLQLRHNSVDETKVRQANWNGWDKLDGNGPSGITLDLTNFVVLRAPFAWYGGGPVRVYALVTNRATDRSHYVLLHTFKAADEKPIFNNPKLPVNAEAKNGATTSSFDLFISGRQFAVIGRYRPNRRNTPAEREEVTVTASSTANIFSVQKKSARISTTKSVKIAGIRVLSDKRGVLKLFIGASLGGSPSFGSVPDVADAETALEYDTAGTGVSGATKVISIPVAASSGNSENTAGTERLGFDVPEGTPITARFTNQEGTDATVSVYVDFEEEW